MNNGYRNPTLQFLTLLVICLLIGGCSNYPKKFSADEETRSAKVLIESRSELYAILGASAKKESIDPPIYCPDDSMVQMAPSAPIENGIIRFGAFTIRHGKHSQFVTPYWWNQKGQLLHHKLGSESDPRSQVIWVNERIFTVNWNGKRIQTFRLNDTSGSEIDELK